MSVDRFPAVSSGPGQLISAPSSGKNVTWNSPQSGTPIGRNSGHMAVAGVSCSGCASLTAPSGGPKCPGPFEAPPAIPPPPPPPPPCNQTCGAGIPELRCDCYGIDPFAVKSIDECRNPTTKAACPLEYNKCWCGGEQGPCMCISVLERAPPTLIPSLILRGGIPLQSWTA